MTLTLNTASGVLHRSARCAGRDTRFHHLTEEPEGHELIAVEVPNIGLVRILVRCRKCLR